MRISPFSLQLRGEELSGTAIYVRRLYFCFGHAMQMMQGQTMQNLIGPNYLFYDGKKCPPYAVRPHLREVHLAYIKRAPKGVPLEEAVALLRACS